MRSSPSPIPVRAILPAVLPGLGERLLDIRIRQEWENLMGPDLARRAQPTALSRGVLQVTVTNSAWLQELTLREPEVRRRLADRYGADSIRALRFSLGTLSTPEPSPRPSPSRGRGSSSLAPGGGEGQGEGTLRREP